MGAGHRSAPERGSDWPVGDRICADDLDQRRRTRAGRQRCGRRRGGDRAHAEPGQGTPRADLAVDSRRGRLFLRGAAPGAAGRGCRLAGDPGRRRRRVCAGKAGPEETQTEVAERCAGRRTQDRRRARGTPPERRSD